MYVIAIVASREVLRGFKRPGLDLGTGQLVELALPIRGEPVQLELPFSDTVHNSVTGVVGAIPSCPLPKSKIIDKYNLKVMLE